MNCYRVKNCFRFMADFEGAVPGACAKDCGNYLDLNLPMAKYWAKKYLNVLENADESNFCYPE